MFNGVERLAALAAILSLAAIGLALALTSLGVPLLLAALLAATASGMAQFTALRQQQPAPLPDRPDERDMQARLEEYRSATASLRHDLRGVMSPALMMSDRLLNHQDPAVQRAGQAVVKSIERATALLATHREALTDEAPKA